MKGRARARPRHPARGPLAPTESGSTPTAPTPYFQALRSAWMAATSMSFASSILSKSVEAGSGGDERTRLLRR
jgi:hypothetical protein